MQFSLDVTAAFFKEWHPKESTMEGSGTSGKPKKVVKVEMRILVDTKHDDGLWSSIDQLWPGMSKVAKAVNADDECDGFDTTCRQQLSQMTVDIYPRESADPDFHFPLVEASGKPKLKMRGDGEAELELRWIASVRRSELAKLSDYIQGDCWLSMELAQPDLTNMTPDNVTVLKKKARSK